MSMSRLGEDLKRWRCEARLNQTEAAAAAGVSQSTISASEDGRLSAQLLQRLITIYAPPDHEVGEALKVSTDAAKEAAGA